MRQKSAVRTAKDVSYTRDILREMHAARATEASIRGFAELAARIGNYDDEARAFWRSVASA